VGRHVNSWTVVSVSNTIKIQLNVLVWYKADLFVISLKFTCSGHNIAWKIAELVLNNNHSFIAEWVALQDGATVYLFPLMGKSWSYLPLQPAVFWVQTPEVECVCDIMSPFPMMQQDKYRKRLQRRMVCTRSGGYHVKYLHKVKVKIFYITMYGQSNYIVKPAHVVTSIKQSPVLKGHHFHVFS
jgi:hypothetical protein